MASSGIAALLLDIGLTAHSRFKIPLHLTPTSQCAITRQSDLAKLLRRTKLIPWDETPMMHKMAFETLDQTLRDILDNDHPFGGLIIIMCMIFANSCQLFQSDRDLKLSWYELGNRTSGNTFRYSTCGSTCALKTYLLKKM